MVNDIYDTITVFMSIQAIQNLFLYKIQCKLG